MRWGLVFAALIGGVVCAAGVAAQAQDMRARLSGSEMSDAEILRAKAALAKEKRMLGVADTPPAPIPYAAMTSTSYAPMATTRMAPREAQPASPAFAITMPPASRPDGYAEPMRRRTP